MEDCIFCKIVGGKLGTEFLHEDSDCVVFRDIHPKAATHLLVVSKKHIDSVMKMDSVDEPIVGHMIAVTKSLAEKLNLSGYRLQINVGKSGGQEIFHLHIHLLSNDAS